MPTEGIDKILKPVERYMHDESTAGIVLLICAVIAMIWANSAWSDSYHHLWEYKISIQAGAYGISKTLHEWINDGLMAMFFFVIGLELKREIMGINLPLSAIRGSWNFSPFNFFHVVRLFSGC